MVNWWVDASYIIHDNCKVHTGAAVTLGKVAMSSFSRNQKIQAKSSTEDELIGAYDTVLQELWKIYLWEDQGYTIEENIVYQGNKSAILLETNRQVSSSNCTKQIKAQFFFVKYFIYRWDLYV